MNDQERQNNTKIQAHYKFIKENGTCYVKINKIQNDKNPLGLLADRIKVHGEHRVLVKLEKFKGEIKRHFDQLMPRLQRTIIVIISLFIFQCEKLQENTQPNTTKERKSAQTFHENSKKSQTLPSAAL
ncbi:hypothetical protein RF11_03485 [Thelohanellus kitauei]|uniref:Uncharacterized protein n=1 Tax=Thelohanellus kitauei TaxID=669202 RepID=A0A0C2M6P2_THEKT|nr:hypothetical protein RF11_03485 [Thelohanellus kitauei]